MSMRLCVVVLLGFVQTALADEVSPFEANLAGYQGKLPAACKISSPQMKLVYACSDIQLPNANPRFYKTVDAGTPSSGTKNSNGVNYCYNSLVDVKTNGDQLSISVWRDSGVNAQESFYRVSKKDLSSRTGEYILPLGGLRGECFGYTEAVNGECSNGIFGFGSTHVDMALRLNLSANNAPTQSLTSAHDIISDARRNASQLNATAPSIDKRRATDAAISYARKQLVAFAKDRMQAPPPNGPVSANDKWRTEQEASAYRLCEEMLVKMENSVNPPPAREPADETVLTEYRRRLNPTESTPTPKARPSGVQR